MAETCDPEKTTELQRMMQELQEVKDMLEAMKRDQTRYELASRTLAALDDRLFYDIRQVDRDTLWNYRIGNFGGIRKAKREWDSYVANARKYQQHPPRPTELDNLVNLLWNAPHVQPFLALISRLESDKSTACSIRTPDRSEFLLYATSLELSDELKNDLVARKHVVEGVLVDLFGP